MATRNVTGTWRSFDAAGPRKAREGTVTFEPSILVRDSITDEIVVQDPVVVDLDANGHISVQLQVTDDANLNPVGWFWVVTEQITGLTARRYQMLLPAASTAFDLSDIEFPYSAVPIDPDEIYIRGFEADHTVVNPDVLPSIDSQVVNSVGEVTFNLPRAADVSIGSVAAGDGFNDAAVSDSGTNGDVVLDFTLPRATLELGDTTVVNPDQNPAVTDSGTEGEAVLDFDLPRAPTFTVGTVTPGADETDAVVTDVGTDGDIVLDVTVPRGVAATADVGTTTPINPDQDPSVANSGTTADAVFDFDLPRAPDFTVGTVTTLPPGSPATVTDVGTDGDIELDFELPKGADGTGTAYYGQMSSQTEQTVTIATSGSYVDMDITGTFDTDNAFGMIAPTTASFGVKNDSGATQLVTVVATADVEIGNNKTAGFRLAINGVGVTETTCTATTGTQNFAKLMTQWFVELEQGDEVSLLVANLSSTDDIDVDRSKIIVFTAGRQGEDGADGAQGEPGVVSATYPLLYNAGTQNISVEALFLNDLNEIDIDSPSTGEVLYYDGALWPKPWVNKALDTDDVSEGSNLYYTDARVQAIAAPLYFTEKMVDPGGGTYTLELSDVAKVISVGGSATVTIEVPSNASVEFPLGTVINVYRDTTGDVTIAGASGVTVRNAGDIADQYVEVSLRKRATNEWVLSGNVA